MCVKEKKIKKIISLAHHHIYCAVYRKKTSAAVQLDS